MWPLCNRISCFPHTLEPYILAELRYERVLKFEPGIKPYIFWYLSHLFRVEGFPAVSFKRPKYVTEEVHKMLTDVVSAR